MNIENCKSGKNLIFLILILGSVTAIGPLAIDMYLPAFSDISENLSAPHNLIQLSLTSYFVGMTLGQLIYGPIIDRFGKKPPLFIGLIIFVITSILCCFVTDAKQLIILRFFQAIGVCGAMVIPRSVVRDIFSTQESARVFSHLMLVMGVAPVLAPILGSFILLKFNWRGIFIFFAIFGLICFYVSYKFIPQTKLANKDEKISGAFKKYREILCDKNFVICAITSGFIMGSLFGYITGSPSVYMDFFGMNSQEYAMFFALNSLGFIGAAQINARILKKLKIEEVLRKSLFFMACSGFILLLVTVFCPVFWAFIFIFFIFLACIGGTSPNLTALALKKQTAHSGSASALLGAIQFVFAVTVSFVVSFLPFNGLISMSVIVGVCGIIAYGVYSLLK